MSRRRANELAAAVAAVHARKDELAAEHVAACRPLQAELQRIEQNQLDALVAKRPEDQQLDTRRRELLAEPKAGR